VWDRTMARANVKVVCLEIWWDARAPEGGVG
jgi:hypothetical protein